MVHLNTVKQPFFVNIDQENKCSFHVTMIKITSLLKITAKNEVQLE